MKISAESFRKNRRKIIYWATASVSSLLFWKFMRKEAPVEKTKTVKMLTKDGKLVEVDPKYLKKTGQHLDTREIQNWVMQKKD